MELYIIAVTTSRAENGGSFSNYDIMDWAQPGFFILLKHPVVCSLRKKTQDSMDPLDSCCSTGQKKTDPDRDLSNGDNWTP